ncbi:MAG: 4-hydroxyphenylpyruvate dioxygenase, partial [Rhodospirillaceae bacterium]|nr:4-hydroxyphenylpyruvate dioxygenase [Rhodospirillaceae bacterium]
VVEQGGWPVPVKVQPMELHIPGVHGAGSSRLYFIDRWREFSIYDVDFIPVPTVDPVVPAVAGLHWFGVVQYVGADRSADWCAFYGSLFGFAEVPAAKRFGILPRGSVLASPCGTFYLQLIEPDSLVVDDSYPR